MTHDTKTGGQAFPIPATDENTHHYGMTLRDYFACKATDDDISRHQEFEFDAYGAAPKFSREVARYKFADAMLEARKQGAA